jgi:hypothetical protein
MIEVLYSARAEIGLRAWVEAWLALSPLLLKLYLSVGFAA